MLLSMSNFSSPFHRWQTRDFARIFILGDVYEAKIEGGCNLKGFLTGFPRFFTLKLLKEGMVEIFGGDTPALEGLAEFLIEIDNVLYSPEKLNGYTALNHKSKLIWHDNQTSVEHNQKL